MEWLPNDSCVCTNRVPCYMKKVLERDREYTRMRIRCLLHTRMYSSSSKWDELNPGQDMHHGTPKAKSGCPSISFSGFWAFGMLQLATHTAGGVVVLSLSLCLLF